MKSTHLARPLRGIIPPLVTPLRDRDTLDAAGLDALVEYILAGGVHGLFVLGTTGEGPSLSYRLRYELVERVSKVVAGRVPVMVGVTDTSFVESLRLAEHAAKCGAAALVVAPPYYLPVGQAELQGYFERLVAAAPLPVMIYNMPSCTKVMISPEVVDHCSRLEGVVGLKDSSGNFDYFRGVQKMLRDRPDFTLLLGAEDLVADGVLHGAHGGICGGANLHPRLYVDLYEAAVAKDAARVATLQAAVLQIASTIYSVGAYDSRIIKGIKCGLSCLGICDDVMAEPFERFGRAERERIRRAVAELGLKERDCTTASATA